MPSLISMNLATLIVTIFALTLVRSDSSLTCAVSPGDLSCSW
jgi:hypothetical protein